MNKPKKFEVVRDVAPPTTDRKSAWDPLKDAVMEQFRSVKDDGVWNKYAFEEAKDSRAGRTVVNTWWTRFQSENMEAQGYDIKIRVKDADMFVRFVPAPEGSV